jgi:hypothetical protein
MHIHAFFMLAISIFIYCCIGRLDAMTYPGPVYVTGVIAHSSWLLKPKPIIDAQSLSRQLAGNIGRCAVHIL